MCAKAYGSIFSPGWCSSVGWALACEPKGHWFDSPSGHKPGLRARSAVGVWEATNGCFSCTSMLLSLFLHPFPFSKKINKSFKKIKCLHFRDTTLVIFVYIKFFKLNLWLRWTSAFASGTKLRSVLNTSKWVTI